MSLTPQQSGQLLDHAKRVGSAILKEQLLHRAVLLGSFEDYKSALRTGQALTFSRFLFKDRRLDAIAFARLEQAIPPPQWTRAPGEADQTTVRITARPDATRATRAMPTEALQRLPDAPPQLPELSATPAPPVASPTLWLECEPLPPIPVGLDETVLIGRGADCRMVLPHQGVSRVHVAIVPAGGALVLEDRSTYGTFVNGEGVSRHPLEPGDVITIGPYMIVVREDVPTDEADDTLPFRIQGFDSGSEGFHGALGSVTLAEILQQIDFNQKTGTLKLRDDAASGSITFDAGRPRYAEWGEQRGADAVFAMLEQSKGEFSFLLRLEPHPANLDGATVTGLLLEAGRRIDEAQD